MSAETILTSSIAAVGFPVEKYTNVIRFYSFLVSCKPGFARCNNSSSLCYDFNRGRCNGVLDCPGGEDEHACGKWELLPVTSALYVLMIFQLTALNCGSQMACRTRGGCYRTSARCNGHHDCPDGSDEEGCDSSLCGPHREGFLCRNQRCIPAFSRCDGIQDCGDFSDEDSCMKVMTFEKGSW